MKVEILIMSRTVRKKGVGLEGASQLADKHQPGHGGTPVLEGLRRGQGMEKVSCGYLPLSQSKTGRVWPPDWSHANGGGGGVLRAA